MRGLNRLRLPSWLGSAGALTLLLLSARPASAAEDYQRFLDALRDRQYYDVVLDNLDRLRGDPQVSDEFKKRIPYEEGTTLIAASVAERDADQKIKLLNSARDKLTQFVKGEADPALKAEAESQLGNVLLERAKTLLRRAALPKYASQKVALTEEARGLFTEAQTVFTSAEKTFAEQYKQLPKGADKRGSPRNSGLEEARFDLRRARLFAAQATYESSKAYPAESPERKKLLESAAAKFSDLREKGRGELRGLLAAAYLGRCYLELGDTKQALGAFTEILAQPDEPAELRRLKAHALHLALQTWSGDKEKNYETAAQKGLDWLNKPTRGVDTRSPDWLAIRYYTALALKQHAASLGKTDDARKRQELKDARKQAKEAAALPGEYQDQAKQLYQELIGTADGDEKPPANFAEAFEQGKLALEAMEEKLTEIKLAPSAGDTANVPTYERDSEQAREKARAMFRLALDSRDRATALEDVNNARFYLCYLAYQAHEYVDAAVLGEFLARRHPTASGSRRAARIALLSHLQSYNLAAPDDRASEKRRMESLADFITRRFAGEAEADEAWMTLMVVATHERNVDLLLSYLAKIPEQSPRRAEAELKAGQALWYASLMAAREPEESRRPQADIDKMRAQAQETLSRGVERITKSSDPAGASFAMAAAALSLSQIYLETGRAADAVKLLEDAKIGPLALVEAKSPIAAEGSFAPDTFKTALRAYVATGQLDKAEKVITALETSVAASAGAEGDQMLIATYQALGRELENHVATLRQEKRFDDLQALSRGFELFLDRILAKEHGNNFKSLNWVAETYARLGAGYESDDDEASPQARAYYEKAAATDEKILSMIKADSGFATPEAALAVKVRLAKSRRHSGHYKEAIDTLVDVLKQRPNVPDLQREAAYAYQAWGRDNPATYELAINGGRKEKDSKGQEYNLLWGWSRLALLTKRDKARQEIFHEASYNVAKCWLLSALKQEGSAKTDALKKAESAVRLTVQLHPDLGGGDWPMKYDKLLRRIQQESGQPQTGLPPRTSAEDQTGRADTAAVK